MDEKKIRRKMIIERSYGYFSIGLVAAGVIFFAVEPWLAGLPHFIIVSLFILWVASKSLRKAKEYENILKGPPGPKGM